MNLAVVAAVVARRHLFKRIELNILRIRSLRRNLEEAWLYSLIVEIPTNRETRSSFLESERNGQFPRHPVMYARARPVAHVYEDKLEDQDKTRDVRVSVRGCARSKSIGDPPYLDSLRCRFDKSSHPRMSIMRGTFMGGRHQSSA